MKNILFAILATLTITASANSTPLSKNSGNNRWLPREGAVTADKLCHFNNEAMLRVSIPATKTEVCLESYVDHSNSTHPTTVCTKSKIDITPAHFIETSTTYVAKACVKTEYKPNQNGYMMPNCLQQMDVTLKDSLNYTSEEFDFSDYLRLRPTTSVKKISACN
ncbi:MAG: hypothetical protein ABL927_09510 [Bdellovibrionales bacterium]